MNLVRRVVCCGGLLIVAVMLGGCARVSPASAELLKAAAQDYDAGHWRAAESQASKFIEIYGRSPAVAEAYYIRGMARFQQGRIAESQADFEKALNLARRKDLAARAHAMLGHLSMRREQYARAVAHYRSALADWPADLEKDEVYFRLAVCLQRLGRWQEARLPLARLIKEYPDSRYNLLARRRLAWPNAYYSVQCGVYRQLENALRQVERLRSAGLDARQSMDVLGAEPRYVVLVGKYSTYPSAKAALRRIRSVVPDAIVVP